MQTARVGTERKKKERPFLLQPKISKKMKNHVLPPNKQEKKRGRS
jgi:hypothetical protein